MAGIGKDFQFRTSDSILKELRIFYGGELVIIPTEDKRGKKDFFYLFHEVEPITGQKVAVEDLRLTSNHPENPIPN